MSAAPKRPAPAVRASELILAQVHLRLGSLALARTELETLAGLGRLDPAGLIDLAEVRWRTGDIVGAGEAANAALRTDEEHPVALLIASEASSAIGRPSEARRLALRAMANATGSIDVTFAGMPRSSAWPPDSDEPPPAAPTMFDRPPEPEPAGDRTRDEAPDDDEAPGSTTTGPVTLGFWDDPRTVAAGAQDLPDPARELDAGRVALAAGAMDEAALRFGLAIRLAPALAPAVLEATAGARIPALIIVRGDAYRLAGHELEAREAFLVAAHGGLPERRKRSRVKGARARRGTGADSPAGEAADADRDLAELFESVGDDVPGEPAADAPYVDPLFEPSVLAADVERPADDAEGSDAEGSGAPVDDDPSGAAEGGAPAAGTADVAESADGGEPDPTIAEAAIDAIEPVAAETPADTDADPDPADPADTRPADA